MKSETANRPHTVYAAYASDGSCLYVGMTSSWPNRRSAHGATALWAKFATRWTTSVVPNRAEALRLETALIDSDRPLFNRKKNRAETADPFTVLIERLRA